MANTKGHKPDRLKEEQQFWDAYVRIRRQEGVDVNGLLAEWVREEKRKLDLVGGVRHFTELCNNGCVPQVLVGIIAFIRFSPNAEGLWSKVVGGPYSREKAVRGFEAAAAMIDDLFKPLTLLEHSSEELGRLKALGRIPPSDVASELRFYARFVTLAERLSKDAQVRSVAVLSQYALVGYVRRATGRFHDRATSGLIASLRDRPAYNEIAHRMWRSRNYARYDKNFGGFVDLMTAFGVVIARSR